MRAAPALQLDHGMNSFLRLLTRTSLCRSAALTLAAVVLGGCSYSVELDNDFVSGAAHYTENGVTRFAIGDGTTHTTTIDSQEVAIDFLVAGASCDFNAVLRFDRPTDVYPYEADELHARLCIVDFEPLRAEGFCAVSSDVAYDGPWGAETCFALWGRFDVSSVDETCGGDVCAEDLVMDMALDPWDTTGLSGSFHLEHDEAIDAHSSSSGGGRFGWMNGFGH